MACDAPLSLRLSIFPFLISASGAAAAQAAPLAPCINTNSGGLVDQVMQVTPADRPDSPIQFFGKLVSWDPQSGAVGFVSDFSNNVEHLPVKAVGFSFQRPSMAAQMPIPNVSEYVAISQTYAATQIKIDQGILQLPDCIMPALQHEFRFEGTLTFDTSNLTVEGTFYDIEPPAFGTGQGPSEGKGG